MILLLVCVLLTAIPKRKQPIVITSVVIELGLLITSIVQWVRFGGEFYAFSFFALLVILFYTVVYAITAGEEERSLMRDISFGSYGTYLLVAIAALVATACVVGDGCDCDGDCCDCCDCSDFNRGKRKSNKLKKQ